MKVKILKGKDILIDSEIQKFHNENNLFIQQDPRYCCYNIFPNSKNLIFQIKENNCLLAYASLSHYKNRKINILTNIPSISSHSSFSFKKSLGKDKSRILKKLFFEIKKYCFKEKIDLLSFSTDPLLDDIIEINKIIKPDLNFRNFLQILRLEKIKLNNKIIKLRIETENVNQKNLKEFYKNYLKLFRSKNYNIVSFKCFQFLKNLKTKIYYVFKDKELLNSTIIIENNNLVVEYFLSLNFSNKYRANTILIDFLLKKYKSENFKYFNFQSSKKINDGTFQFKKNFKPDLKYFFYLTKIFIKKRDFEKNINLYQTKDNRFIYPKNFSLLRNYSINYIK